MRPQTTLLAAGVAVWALVGGSTLAAHAHAAWTGLVPYALAWLAFLAAFLYQTQCANRGSGLLALGTQSACAVVMAHSQGASGMEAALLVAVAGQLPARLPISASIAWVAVQTAVLMGLSRPFQSVGVSGAGIVRVAGAYTAFQLFAIGAASLAESERRAREQLAAAKADLEHMQALSLELTRQAERLKIARDLHDSLGHRLTALGLALEAARHEEISPAAAARLGTARELGSALLSDLRDAVGMLREGETPELRTLLEGLGRSVPSPKVSVDVSDSLRITSPEASTALYRMCQEIVTNASRHAHATQLRLSLKPVGEHAVLEGADDGVSGQDDPQFEPGNGLIGLRERARLLGGDAEFAFLPSGFRVVARIPLARLG